MLPLLWPIAVALASAACPDGSADPACDGQDGDVDVPLDPEQPNCLATPPPDGLYGIPDPAACAHPADCDPILARPVAVVAGCVGGTPGEAWTWSFVVTRGARFLSVDSDGKRCNSGKSAVYTASPEGLTGQFEVWTQCGGGVSRKGEPVALTRIEEVVATDDDGLVAAFEHAATAVRAAALEAIGVRQPERWTCEPIARAIRGGLGAEATRRAVLIARTPCLADPLRVALFDHRFTPAAEALARLVDSRDALAEDLVRAVREGLYGAPRPLADRLDALGGVDSELRDALGAALLNRKGGDESRQAAVEALDRLFREPADGKALLALDRRGSCSGWRLLLDTLAVEARLGSVPPDALARTWKPLVALCDRASEHATGALLGRLEAGDAPDAAWIVAADALEAHPEAGFPDRFPGLACGAAIGGGPGEQRVRQALSERRCL